ncbi:MAG: hypothetical protein JWQ49_3167 [Edaphobacter sp.]|nr:hypothetical protein [Edaphobacter sp.]
MILTARSRSADTLRAAVPPAIIALTATLLLLFPPAQYSFYPRCPIHELLHLQCPGCGATRSIAAMLRGDFAEAMNLNGLVTLLLPFAAVYGILCYTRLLQRKPLCWPQPPSVILYTALSVATLFTIIRNLPPYSY